MQIDPILQRALGLGLFGARIGDVRRQPHLVHRLDDGPRRDPVLLVVPPLDLAPPIHLAQGTLHRSGHPVGVEDGPAVDVAGRAADRLHERAVGAEKPFLIGVEDRHEGYLGQIEPFAQKIDSHQDIEVAQPKAAENFHPLDGVDVGVQIAHPHSGLLQIVGEVFGHALGERGDQDSLALRLTHAGSRPGDRPPARGPAERPPRDRPDP